MTVKQNNSSKKLGVPVLKEETLVFLSSEEIKESEDLTGKKRSKAVDTIEELAELREKVRFMSKEIEELKVILKYLEFQLNMKKSV
jgi:predicted S18 family serine protease